MFEEEIIPSYHLYIYYSDTTSQTENYGQQKEITKNENKLYPLSCRTRGYWRQKQMHRKEKACMCLVLGISNKPQNPLVEF